MQRRVDIDALGKLLERTERHAVAQQHAHQRPKQPHDGGFDGLPGTNIHVHDWDIRPKNRRASSGHL